MVLTQVEVDNSAHHGKHLSHGFENETFDNTESSGTNEEQRNEWNNNNKHERIHLNPLESNLNEFLQTVDSMIDGSEENKEEVYGMLQEKIQLFPENSELLWRLAKSLYNLAVLKGLQGDADAKKELIEEGVIVAEISLEINDNDANAHKWYAVLQGMTVEFASAEERIKLGHVYKEHIDRAIELDPKEASTYSLLGRWCFEVYMMPWYVRTVASSLFAEPPSSTVQEALQNFMKAEEISPGSCKMNTLYIGKCYYQMSEYSTAKEWLLQAKELPLLKPEDEETQSEVDALLQRL